jgi:hypothetical protein
MYVHPVDGGPGILRRSVLAGSKLGATSGQHTRIGCSPLTPPQLNVSNDATMLLRISYFVSPILRAGMSPGDCLPGERHQLHHSPHDSRVWRQNGRFWSSEEVVLLERQRRVPDGVLAAGNDLLFPPNLSLLSRGCGYAGGLLEVPADYTML